MATNESNSEIKWTSEKVWGAVGLTHHAEVMIAGARYTFTVDQSRKGQWIARGWRDGNMFFYRDALADGAPRTLTGMKEQVERQIGELKIVAVELVAQEAELRDGAVDRLAVGLDLPTELVENTSAVGTTLPKPPSPEALAATLGLSDGPDEPECWCEWVDIGVGMQRAAETPGCPQHHPDPLVDLSEDYVPGRPVVDRPLPEVDMIETARHLNALLGVVKGGMGELGRRVATAVDEMTHLLRKSFHSPPCGCPTPTHRMSCGVGAVPKVVFR
jgi:hypothetical protein